MIGLSFERKRSVSPESGIEETLILYEGLMQDREIARITYRSGISSPYALSHIRTGALSKDGHRMYTPEDYQDLLVEYVMNKPNRNVKTLKPKRFQQKTPHDEKKHEKPNIVDFVNGLMQDQRGILAWVEPANYAMDTIVFFAPSSALYRIFEAEKHYPLDTLMQEHWRK
ncbi:hypothetical protein ACFL3V_03415 [Nanoarchaeota archaeon]